MAKGDVWVGADVDFDAEGLSCNPGAGEEGIVTVINHNCKIKIQAYDNGTTTDVLTEAEMPSLGCPGGKQISYVSLPCTNTYYYIIYNDSGTTDKVCSFRGWKTK